MNTVKITLELRSDSMSEDEMRCRLIEILNCHEESLSDSVGGGEGSATRTLTGHIDDYEWVLDAVELDDDEDEEDEEDPTPSMIEAIDNLPEDERQKVIDAMKRL